MNTINKSMLMACFFLTSTIAASAQNEVDALRYSQHSFGTTARSLAMGGAFGALGADFSSLGINPAGIAVYRRSEFTISPVLQIANNDAAYLNRTSSDTKGNFGLGNLGVVFAFPKEKKTSGWQGFAFGIGYNRINSFSRRVTFEGVNNQNSINNYFAELAAGVDETTLSEDPSYQFDAGLAYHAYLINPIIENSVNTSYYSSITQGGTLRQKGILSSKGSQGEIDISFGGNYDDKIFLGATIGIPYMNYTQTEVLEEFDDSNNSSDTAFGRNFKTSTFTKKLTTEGNGVNLKLGLIYKPSDMFRLGLAIHTPTYYELNDQYSSSLDASFTNSTYNYSDDSPDGKFSYNLLTPFKAIASAAVLFNGQGLISVDYEYLDYGMARLGSAEDDISFTDENNTIKDKYSYGQNLNIGAEYRYKIFAFRIGSALQSSPFDGKFDLGDKSNLSSLSYTGGFGIKGEHFFFDIAYAYTKYNSYYAPYSLLEGTPVASVKNVQNRFMTTFGIKF